MSLINDALKRANEAQKNRPVAGPLGAPLQPADAPMRRSGGSNGTNWMTVVVPVAIVLLLGLAFWFIRSGMQPKPAEQTIVAVTSPVPLPPKPVAPPAPVPAPVHVAAAPVAPKAPEKPSTYVSKNGIKVNTEIVTREIPAPTPAPAKIEVAVVAPEINVPGTPAAPVTSAPVTPAPVAVAPEMKAEPKTEPVVAATPVVPAPAPQPVVAKPEPPKPVFPELKLQGIFYRLTNPSALVSGKNVRVGDSVQGVKIIAIERASVTLDFKGERKTLSLDVQ
jgi:hypothetical protein